MQGLIYLIAGIALIFGIALAGASSTPPQLFGGLTFVICSIVVISAGAVIGAVDALRRGLLASSGAAANTQPTPPNTQATPRNFP